MFHGPIIQPHFSQKRKAVFQSPHFSLNEDHKAIIATAVLGILTLTGGYLQYKIKHETDNHSIQKIDTSLQGFEL